MSRKARIRDKNSPHHVMSRSIPELNLFNNNEDKERYLSLMKHASRVYRVSIIAYCLMDNHVHMLIHPNGGNMSKFMKNINNPYAKYYNKENERRGHLFGERFKNIIIRDEVQLLRASTYIHNNAKDLLWQGYRSIADYPYSSIKDYISPVGGRGLVDPSIIFDYMTGEGIEIRNHYKVLLEIQSQGHEEFEKEVEEAFKKGAYQSDRVPIIREVEPTKVLSMLERILGRAHSDLALSKYRRSEKTYKCLVAISLRIFCGMTMKDMTNIFKGYSTSSIGQLSKEGYRLMVEKDLFNQLATSLSN